MQVQKEERKLGIEVSFDPSISLLEIKFPKELKSVCQRDLYKSMALATISH
jgi:hypothetical protein